MARAKYKTSTKLETCADCSAPEAGWASINRAILLCDECCSIHRSLGRHVSIIKSLHKGFWSSYLLSMVHTLNENGANNIWEHLLMDSSASKVNRRKPQPKDPLHPVKSEFIRAKHQQLAFILRPAKDEFESEEELSKQLHSSVRTGNLETSLRLLAQGANPSYFYKEKGTNPLHVAARAGQALQLELLIANGGNPSLIDSNGHTPADIAKMTGHLDIAEHLTECMYEVTDRLTFYLCSQKPDHRTTEHLIIPDWAETLDRSNLVMEARNRLQQLSNNLLEELVMDVYDEVDRRELEAVWLSSANLPEKSTVPFLPVNPHLSSTRNQGRQKLARFTAKEFATLIIDILTEAGHRHMLSSNNIPLLKDPTIVALQKEHLFIRRGSQISDDEPLYDSVASDDDYAALGTDNKSSSTENKDNEKILVPVSNNQPPIVQQLKKQLNVSDSIIKNLQDKMCSLQQTIEQLSLENRQLKSIIQIHINPKIPNNDSPLTNGHNENDKSVLEGITSSPRGNQRPASMYETREGLKKTVWTLQSIRQSKMENDFENSANIWNKTELPSNEEVTHRIEQVTKRIQELWKAMQDPTHREVFVPCAERIHLAVFELTSIFPQNPTEENIQTALKQLQCNTGKLQIECAGLQRCLNDNEHVDHCLQQVRSCAYDIAKATKLLVTQFQIS